jgi:hypothetical protein
MENNEERKAHAPLNGDSESNLEAVEGLHDAACCASSLLDGLSDDEISRCKTWGEYAEKRGVPKDKIPYREFVGLNNGDALEKVSQLVVKNGGQPFFFHEKSVDDGFMDYLATFVDPSISPSH